MEPLRHHRFARKRHPAENPPTAEDYYRGVMPDGSPVPSLSAFLTDPYDHEIPGAPDKRSETINEIERALDMELLRDYDSVLDGLRKLKTFCDERLEEEFEAERAAAQEAREIEAAEAAKEATDAKAGENTPADQPKDKPARKPATPRTPRARVRPPRVVSFLALYMQVLKNLLEIAKDRAGFARELIQRASKRDIRRTFIEDRAVGVVRETLLELDKTFKDVGFGSWMPFRFPDQWLMFTGVMRRVLAANGLIAAKHADVYRRLLQETPPVIPPLDKLPTPRSWGFSGRTREVPNMAELLKLSREEKEYLESREAYFEENARRATEQGRIELEKLQAEYEALNKRQQAKQQPPREQPPPRPPP